MQTAICRYAPSGEEKNLADCERQMSFLEQQLTLAKLVRKKGADAPQAEQELWIRKSDSFLACA